MKKKAPRVSVIMPTYNQALFLPRALQSLGAQEFRDFELIAVNDASTDQTAGMLDKEFRAGLVDFVINRWDNSATAAAPINDGFRQARGEFVTWVSSDNTMAPNFLSALVGAMDEDTGAAFGAFNYHKGDAVVPQRRPGPYSRADLIASPKCYFGPAFLIRRSVWAAVGDHSGGTTAHDYDHWLRVEDACESMGFDIRYVDEILCDYFTGSWQTAKRRPELNNAREIQERARRRRGQPV